MVNVVLLAVPVKNASTLENCVAYCAGEVYACFVGFEMFRVILLSANIHHNNMACCCEYHSDFSEQL